MTIRALVVDDEPLARSRMRRLLADHPDVEVVGEAADGREAVEAVLNVQPDVLFLDVQMPGQSGTEALRAIHAALPEELWPPTVFTTAFEDHAVEAFELEGTDYLLKPVEKEALARALRRVRKALWGRHRPQVVSPPPPPIPELPSAPEPPPESLSTDHLAAHRGNKIVNVPYHQVACILVEDTITFAYTPAGRLRLKMALHEVEARLPSPPFLRVSRSALIQIAWVQHLEAMGSGVYEAVIRDPVGMRLRVSRRRARRLRELLGW